jgi:hypothetical protein
MDSTNIEAVDCHCPLCGEAVLKTTEVLQEGLNDAKAKCSNEYFLHKGYKLYKITNPTTPTDVDRKKYE